MQDLQYYKAIRNERPCFVAQNTTDATAIRRGEDQKKAVIAASVIGTLLVLVYSLVSFLLLLRYLS